jgi:hypothetical protein
MSDQKSNILSPKEFFLNQRKPDGMPLADGVGESLRSPDFHHAAQCALLQYSLSLRTDNQMEAMANSYRLEGAKEFLKVLMTISDNTINPVFRPDEQLQET